MISIFKKPKQGDNIKITWLSKNNGWPNKNIYIGSIGIVRHQRGSWFALDTGSAWLIINGIYCWKLIKQ